mgnify:CR=1 FL=1
MKDKIPTWLRTVVVFHVEPYQKWNDEKEKLVKEIHSGMQNYSESYGWKNDKNFYNKIFEVKNEESNGNYQEI